MRTFVFLLFFSLMSLSFASCNKSIRQNDSSLITFDATKHYASKTMDIHDIANVDYLILETKDSFLYSHCVYITEHYIIALNSYDCSYVFFNRQGKAVSRISRYGQGPEDYMHFWIQTYSEKEDNLYVFSYPNKIQVYNRFGVFKRSLPLRNDSSGEKTNLIDAIFDYNSKYLLCHDKLATKSNSFYLLSKINGEMKDLNIHFDKKISSQITSKQEDGMTMLMTFFISSAVPDGKDYILNEYSSDTLFALKPDLKLQAKFVHKPSVGTNTPPILLDGLLDIGQYTFFSAYEMAYDFAKNEGGKENHYVLDNKSGTFYEVTMKNKDYADQDLTVDASNFISGRSSDSKLGFIKLGRDDLEKADSDHKLSGPLKKLFDSMNEEDPFILMIVHFK